MLSKSEYDAIVDDRPRKAAPEDVNFRPDDGEGFPCVSCIHFYVGIAMEHTVCEIMRPPDEQVPWNWTCNFHTSDGETFPKLKG